MLGGKNGPTELESGAVPTQEFQSVKSTLQALEEIGSGNVVVHPDPEAKREALRRRIEAERIRKEEEERKIKGTNCQRKKKMVKKFRVGDFSILFLLFKGFRDKVKAHMIEAGGEKVIAKSS